MGYFVLRALSYSVVIVKRRGAAKPELLLLLPHWSLDFCGPIWRHSFGSKTQHWHLCFWSDEPRLWPLCCCGFYSYLWRVNPKYRPFLSCPSQSLRMCCLVDFTLRSTLPDSLFPSIQDLSFLVSSCCGKLLFMLHHRVLMETIGSSCPAACSTLQKQLFRLVHNISNPSCFRLWRAFLTLVDTSTLRDVIHSVQIQI